MQMKRLAYLWVLLLISAQVDDTWATAPVLPSAPLAEDEFLPSQPRSQVEESSPHQKPVVVGFKSPIADFPLDRRGVLTGCTLTTPFAPPPLYVFMSLRI
jgi:hypothetical protein